METISTEICECSFEQKNNRIVQNKKNTLNVTFCDVFFRAYNHCNANDFQHFKLQRAYFLRFHSQKCMLSLVTDTASIHQQHETDFKK